MQGIPYPPFEIAGKYEVEKILGRGGMGVVYMARQKPLGRKVAVKMILAWHCEDESFIRRFKREATLVSQISHQNVVAVYDVVEHEGNWCIVLEFVEGRSLKEEIDRRGRVPVATALKIAEQTAEALEFCHRRKIVHRDIKPDNIMIDADRRVKVMDFGVAKDANSTQRTQTGVAIGTPKYMSPEQAQGLPDIDGRSDIYSLGCVLFEMVTGRVPFEGDQSLAIALAHVREAPPRPAQFLAGLDPKVEQLILRCLAKKPDDRYQTAAELAEQLRRLLGITAAEAADAVIPEMEGDDGTALMDSGPMRAAGAALGETEPGPESLDTEARRRISQDSTNIRAANFEDLEPYEPQGRLPRAKPSAGTIPAPDAPATEDFHSDRPAGGGRPTRPGATIPDTGLSRGGAGDSSADPSGPSWTSPGDSGFRRAGGTRPGSTTTSISLRRAPNVPYGTLTLIFLLMALPVGYFLYRSLSEAKARRGGPNGGIVATPDPTPAVDPTAPAPTASPTIAPTPARTPGEDARPAPRATPAPTMTPTPAPTATPTPTPATTPTSAPTPTATSERESDEAFSTRIRNEYAARVPNPADPPLEAVLWAADALAEKARPQPDDYPRSAGESGIYYYQAAARLKGSDAEQAKAKADAAVEMLELALQREGALDARMARGFKMNLAASKQLLEELR